MWKTIRREDREGAETEARRRTRKRRSAGGEGTEEAIGEYGMGEDGLKQKC